jgi:hypothetical protein
MDRVPVVGRIGREPRPGEGTVRLVRERPEVLEYMSRRTFATELNLSGEVALEEWDRLSAAQRADWIDRTFASLSAGARHHDETRPPDDPAPDDGGGEPIDLEEPTVIARVA